MVVIFMVGLLEALAAMSVGKLILLGALALTVGIPALGILAWMVTEVAGALSPNRKQGIRIRESISPKTRALGWGIFFLALGLGILVAIAADVQIWGIVGLALLFGGISLIIFYFIAVKSERRETYLEKDEEEAL